MDIATWSTEQPIENDAASINLSVKDTSNNLSSNANLSSITLSAGSLSPSFNANTTSYTVTVPYDTTSIVISAVAEDSDAKVTVNKTGSLSVGTNTRTISVVAPDGTQKTYTIKITRQSDPNAPTTEAAATTTTQAVVYPIVIDGINYRLTADLSGIQTPGSCYSLTSTVIDGAEVAIYQHNNADIKLVYLMNQENQGAFFIYDSTTGSYTDFISIQSGDNFYTLVKEPEDTVFDNYEKSSISVGSYTVDAWNIPVNDEVSDFYLIYAVNSNGDAQWYQYDVKEKTIQRYHETSVDASTEVQNDVPLQKSQFIYCIIIGILTVFVLLFGILFLFNRKSGDSTAKHIR